MRCERCGQENREGARFCDACGHRLGQAGGPDPITYTPGDLAKRILAQRESVGERKHVTVLFADVSGSMDLAERTDPEEWRKIMDRFFARLCDGVHRYEGTVVQFTGDGIMALFGAPIAHEDHAARAARSALDLRADLSEYAAELRRERGLSFSVRIGLNSGEVVVGAIGDDLRVDYTAIGHTVGLAQRMESLAAPGAVFVTEQTAALLAGYFELRDLGPHTVKGVREPVRVFELAGTGRARSRLDVARERGLSRFVGRTTEMDVLEAALEAALDGHGRVVGVVGEPGVGKSRLCHEFAERCRARGIPVAMGAGQAHARNVPFHTALDLMRGYYGLSDADDPQVARERVAGKLLLLDPEFADDLPLVFDFFGIPDPQRPAPRMDPDARRRRLLEIVRGAARARSAREAGVTLIDDAHWIDEGSLIMLSALVEATEDCRSLIVVNFRPEFRAGWMQDERYVELPVVPLGAEAADALIAHLLGDDPSLSELADAIRERTSGNPFFVEELVNALVEQGALSGERGRYRLCCPIEQVAVPPSVQAVLAARIDRLDAPEKALLQAASVIGKEFEAPVLAHVSGEDVGGGLRALVAAGFVYERGGDQYAFRHPLTQEVAYGSQLAEGRRADHAAVAAATAELHPDRLDELAALIAQHWEQAGERLQAARWHARAAAWAGVNDSASARAHWERVRALADELPEDAETNALGLAARTWLLQIGWRLGSTFQDVETAFAEAREMAERVGDRGTQAILLALYGGAVGITRDMHEGATLSRDAMRLAVAANNPAVQVAVYPLHTYCMMTIGSLEDALAELRRIRALLEVEPGAAVGGTLVSPYAWTHMLEAFILGLKGEVAEARETNSTALRLAAADGDLETLGWAHQNHAMLAHVSGVLDGAVAHVTRSAEIAGALGSAFSRVWAGFNVGWISMLTGDLATAEAAYSEALGLVEETRTGAEGTPWARGGLAATLIAQGRLEEGRRMAERAFAESEAPGVVAPRALGRQVVARALLDRGEEHGVEEHLRAALELCCRHGLRGEEALVRRDLADLARLRGEPDAEHLREAARLFELNGATGHLEALAPRLAALAA